MRITLKPQSQSARPRKPGTPAKPHLYAGDERLTRVLAELRSSDQPSAVRLAAEWDVTQRTAERIIRAARELSDEQQTDLAERWRGDTLILRGGR